MGFVKLHDTMLDSTIWSYDSDTIRVWITMLLMCDQYGIIECRAPGIARRAGLTLDVTLKAIDVFSSPDKYSRTRDFDGRRVEETDVGYLILNYQKYREKLSRISELERKRRWAEKNRSRLNDAESSDDVDASSDDRHKQKQKQKQKQKHIEEVYQSSEFIEFWNLYPKKVGKLEAAKAIKKLLKKQSDYDTMMKSLKTYRFSKEKQYIPNPATWLNQRRWEDEDETAKGSGIKYDA
jgi:hypothetical protein